MEIRWPLLALWRVDLSTVTITMRKLTQAKLKWPGTIKDLLIWIKDNLVQERPDLLLLNGTVYGRTAWEPLD